MTARAKARSLKNVRSASTRSAYWAVVQSNIDPPPRGVSHFLDKHVLEWLLAYLKVIFSSRYPFPRYTDPPSLKPGVFTLEPACTIALAGDWGSGTDNAYRVMDDIRKRNPDITVHLGDIYYSGTIEEVEQYFLGPDDWYVAPQSFALNGNHEMYSGGAGYFSRVLPALHQATSYFCLENDYWRFVGLDTGYYSKVFPILELFLGTRHHDAVLEWLQEVVFADKGDRRPVVLMSHHQWFSAFDRGYDKVGTQLAPFLPLASLWFWGHEHRFAGYASYAPDGRTPVRSRCIGHGGMPVELMQPKHIGVPLVFVDNRKAAEVEGVDLGFCGYTVLELDGPSMTVRYIDEQGDEVLVEQWTSGGRGGGATGKIQMASPLLQWVRDAAELVR